MSLRRARALFVAVSLAVVPRPAAQQAPRFPVGVEVVRVSVLVTGRDGPIVGLGAGDFEVRDNDVAQKVEYARSEELPMDLVLAFDASGSVNGRPLVELQRAASAIVDSLKAGDQAALLTFADSLRLRSPLGDDVAALRARIATLEADGGTSVADATFAAVVLGDGLPGRALAIVFTDGQGDVSWLPEKDALDAARRSEVVVYSALVGGGKARFLDDVAAATGGRVLRISSHDRLMQAFRDIVEEFRTRYLLSFTPHDVAPGGWHRLEISVKGRLAKVLARTGYLGAR